MLTILVVEDDAKLRHLYASALTHHGYSPITCVNGQEALRVISQEHIDLMITDVMMPGQDGYTLTKSVRQAGHQFPILMITAKGQFNDLEQGFTSGADDYMIKPADLNEMMLRIHALLRRAKIALDHRITLAHSVIDSEALSVTDPSGTQTLPQKEFLLLFKLLSYPNKTFTRTQLMDEIWGGDSDSEERTVDVHINRIRERFKHNPDFSILTLRGIGYKGVRHDEK